MPRFFFDHYGGQSLERDEDGLEFPDVEMAYLEAFEAATEMWGEALRQRRNISRDCFMNRDAAGNVVFELPFSEVIESGEGARPTRPSKSSNPPANESRPQELRQDLFAQQREQRAQFLLTLERTQRLRSDVHAQIETARDRLMVSRELLSRFGNF